GYTRTSARCAYSRLIATQIATELAGVGGSCNISEARRSAKSRIKSGFPDTRRTRLGPLHGIRKPLLLSLRVQTAVVALRAGALGFSYSKEWTVTRDCCSLARAEPCRRRTRRGALGPHRSHRSRTRCQYFIVLAAHGVWAGYYVERLSE